MYSNFLLITSILGISSSLFLKDWTVACLWLVIIFQDIQVKKLEEKINELD